MRKFSELFSAFDYLDEIIYISDMDTYDLVYCNKKLEGLLTDDFQADKLGYKCYKCLQGLDHPCVFCNNDRLRNQKRCIWSRINPNTGKNYLIHDSIIKIDDKEYRMELAVDATHLDEAATRTRQRLQAETHLTDCVRYMVHSHDLHNAVSAILQTVLNYFSGDRAYIFEFDWGNDTACNTFEICAPGITAEIDNLQEVPLEHMQRWIETFKHNSTMVIENLELLKDDPEHRVEYEDLSVQGISSLIAVPLYSDNGIIGCVGVDNPSMNISDSDFMADLAYFLGLEIGKNNIVRELKDMSFHDELTGVYNRKGFEQIMDSASLGKHPIALLMVDIDNFKMINDTYGHIVGDEILKETARLLNSAFRSEDVVFRVGGDEFAVLLNNCETEAWQSICSKIKGIHITLSEVYKKIAVTLSVGICFTRGEYSENVYRLADEAMYHTKTNGRAGCTMIDEVTGEKQSWRDDTLSIYSRSVLNINSTGLCRIEYPLDGKTPPRMLCNSAVREIFGFPQEADAETCYRLWEEGIETSYYDVLSDVRRQLMEGVQVECTYEWNHPKYGVIFVRSNGIGETDESMQVIYGYHHSMKDTRIIEKQDDSQLLLEAISSIYFGSYYINLDSDTYHTIKYAPNERFLHVEEKHAQESLLNFVAGLVRKSDHAKMNAFVDLDTISQRMMNETHLDCEYYAVVEDNWCRATFIPVKYHDDGTLSHVLFEVVPLDYSKAQEAEENLKNRRSIELLYNHVPGGLVLYEWDGSKITKLHASQFYEGIYGSIDDTQATDYRREPDFRRVHPDDLEGLQEAIRNALNQTYSLEYIYRGWNNVKQDYVWIKISAVAEVQDDGTALIYAMFSDVTTRKETEIQLEKKHLALTMALGAFSQLYYEYDPIAHTEECLTEDHIFHQPRIAENYPEVMLDIVHPDDQKTFLREVHSMDNGKPETSFNIRLLRGDKYVWYAYKLQSFFDRERGRSIVSMSIMDNSEHMTTIHNYQVRMNRMIAMSEDAIAYGSINLTQNSFSVLQAEDTERAQVSGAQNLDELFGIMSSAVVGNDDQAEYRHTFSRDNLLKLMMQGRTHVHMNHMYRTTSNHVEWVRTYVDMLYNPSTGDVVGVCYVKSIQNEMLSRMLLEKALKRDYPLAAIVEVKNDAYYIFDPHKDQYCIHKQKFWDNIAVNMEQVIDKAVAQEVQSELKKDEVLRELDENNIYSYSFNCAQNGHMRRMEIKLYYIDDSRELVLATLRDITDSVIIEQLRHDNERDHLTDLYNRRKTFAECEKMMREHPDEQFAMLHFDIRHFRLYNTFFGDAAGDKLLCDIADMFRNMDKDYDYWVYGRIESDVFCVFFPINQNKYQKHLDDLLHGLADYRPDFLIESAIGIFTVTDKTMPIESMFTRASMAAKAVRTGVTDSIVFYDENMEKSLTDEQEVVNDMQVAIEREQFKVYLQPKYSLKTGKCIGAEALARWEHPQKGLIEPGRFVPIFEKNGFIATLDQYMWEHVCQLLKGWKDAGYRLVPVSVNVSRISMYSQTLVQCLKELVNKYGIDPKYLELELTETAYMDDPIEMKKQLQELQDYGFHILMDDFGTGYSSLNTLRELPVNCLKLDKEFVSASSSGDRGQKILGAVLSMSGILDLAVIAEGVETQEQADLLRSLGCEMVQGYLFAKPMPVDAYEKFLADENI